MAINLEQFHQTFFDESFEGLEAMESGLLSLARAEAGDGETIHSIFRAAHSIKGGAGTFGFSEVARFTHVLETILDEMRDGRRSVSAEVVNLLLEAVDVLRAMLMAVREKSASDGERVQAVFSRMQALLAGGAPGSPAATAPRVIGQATGGWLIRFRPKPHLFATGNDPLRILRELATLGSLEVEADLSALPALAALDPQSSYLGWLLRLKADVPHAAVAELFSWVEGDAELTIEPMPVDRKTVERSGQERRAGEDRRAGAESTSIRVDTAKIDALINRVGELVITQNILRQVGEHFDMSKLGALHKALADLERNTRELQESVMRIRMLPMSFAFSRFPRLVHDVSRKLGKQVELRLLGEGTELDKTVLEKIVDPLVHLVRNALDHGIEPPEVRRAAGKPETGVLTLSACHKGGNVEIAISDDGAGLNTEKILRKAKERGLVRESDLLTDEQVHELIFQPGFSTAEQVSDVSGRGVGMDVVRKNIGSLGGTVEIASTRGQGARFTVRLPLTLAIMDGQSVAVGTEFYIVPLVSIIVSTQVKAGEVNVLAGSGEAFRFRDEVLPVIRLHELFGARPRTRHLHEGLIVVVEGDGRRAGLFVDELLGQQQVVIKSLEANYRRVEGISGATILGDGSVALILDIPGLIRIAHQKKAA